jgi:hypothetical protein
LVKKTTNYTLFSEELVTSEFEETIGWAINEPLLNSNDIFLNIEFSKIEKSIRFLDSYNPLFLGCVIGGDYFFFNYNGYS